MSARVYLLLEIANSPFEQVAKALKKIPVVLTAEVLEGPPDIVVIIEASDRYELAEFTNQVLASVEDSIENSRVLPVSDDLTSQIPTTMPLF